MELTDLYRLYRQHPSVQTDTRQLRPGDLFFALKGPSFNGNAFARQALEQGAAYAVIDEESHKTDERMLLVEDVLATLQALAAHHRDQFDIPFIAITGSNGKTTTKELVNACLGTTYRTYATEGNLNNHIGIPLTLLRLRKDVEIAVIEMGASHQKEIEGYCRIVRPTHGLITNIGSAHLEGFGGPEGVRKGKGELFDYLRHAGGAAFICRDFGYFQPMSRGIHEVIWYGTTEGDGLTGSSLNSSRFLSFSTGYTGPVSTRLAGNYNIYNALAAIAIGQYFGIPGEKLRQAIEDYTPSNKRSQLIEQDTNTIVLDAYNANPSSMKVAIENFAGMEGGDKVLMLGGMMELGAESVAQHEALLQLVGRYPWKKVALIGGDFAKVHHPYLYFPDAAAAKDWFRQQHFRHTLILVKGSRSISMENILEM